jgi:hypothetical protein
MILSDEQIAEMRAMWEDNFDTLEIAKALKISEADLWNYRAHADRVVLLKRSAR